MFRSRKAPKSSDTQEHIKPIPAFYCCYLLRSTVRHASLYIGSTPDPARRLAQHNGHKKGGAHKTASEKLRPWEMVMIVSGFMSRAAALQFEWAWQHTASSRHADLNDIAGQPSMRICPRTGRQIKTQNKTSRSLTAMIANLHRLLRSSYFSTTPLEVRFFSPDVHRVWQSWCGHAEGLIAENVRVLLESIQDGSNELEKDKVSRTVGALDVGYDSLKGYLEKTQFLLDDGEGLNCGVCKEALSMEDDLIVACAYDKCNFTSHLICLSATFLKNDQAMSKLVPTGGTCPGCHASLNWPTLVKEISLRMRGTEEVRKLFRKRRGAGASTKTGSRGVEAPLQQSDHTDESDESTDETDTDIYDAEITMSVPSETKIHDKAGTQSDVPIPASKWKRPPAGDIDEIIGHMESKCCLPVNDTGWDNVVVLD